MRKRWSFVPVLLAILLIADAGCHGPSTQEPPEDDTEAPVEIAGTWDAGDAQSDWSAAFDRTGIARIAEQVNVGDYGESTTEFYFEDGELVRCETKGLRRHPMGTEGSAFSEFNITV